MKPHGKLIISLLITGIVVGVLAISTPAVPQAPGGGVGWGEMTPEEREDAIAYSNTKYLLYFVGVAYSLMVLLVILFSGFSAQLHTWAKRVGNKWVLVVAVYALFFFLAVTILELPLNFYSGFVLEHQYELSNQTVGAWLWDGAKNLFLSWVIGTIVLLFAYWLIRKSPRAWWATLGTDRAHG